MREKLRRRTAVSILLLLLLPSLALAKRPKARTDSRVTYVEDEPMASSAETGRADPTALSGRRMDAAIRKLE